MISGLDWPWPVIIPCRLLMCYWFFCHSTVCWGENIRCRQRVIDRGRAYYHLDSSLLFMYRRIYHIILTFVCVCVRECCCICVLMHVHLCFLCESPCRRVCVHWQLLRSMRVFVFYPVGEAQLQCSSAPGAMLTLIKHPHRSIGIIRCVCFPDCKNERKQKEVWKRENDGFWRAGASERDNLSVSQQVFWFEKFWNARKSEKKGFWLR